MIGMLYWCHKLCLDYLGSIRTHLMCLKPVALRYWYDAWWLAWRQAIDNQLCGSGPWTSTALGGRVGSARQKRSESSTGRRLAPGGVRCLPGGLEPDSA